MCSLSVTLTARQCWSWCWMMWWRHRSSSLLPAPVNVVSKAWPHSPFPLWSHLTGAKTPDSSAANDSSFPSPFPSSFYPLFLSHSPRHCPGLNPFHWLCTVTSLSSVSVYCTQKKPSHKLMFNVILMYIFWTDLCEKYSDLVLHYCSHLHLCNIILTFTVLLPFCRLISSHCIVMISVTFSTHLLFKVTLLMNSEGKFKWESGHMSICV